MFRKLVSSLSFSPALVGQLGFYARRLKKEQATRRLGLIFTALALVMQSFAVLTPPEPANAANPSDMMYGGVSSKAQLLTAYDNSARGNGDIKNIYDYVGITRDEIANTKESTMNSRQKGTGAGGWVSWGRVHRFSAANGEVQHNANGVTVYSRPNWLYDTSSYAKKKGTTQYAFVGYSASIGEFAILKGCGNLVTTKLPVTPPPPPPVAPPAESRCVLLQVKRIERTKYSFDATAQVTNGATISNYAFVVKNAAGAIVSQQSVPSSATTASSTVIELKTAGSYTASVSVTTSAGERSGGACVAPLTVSPPDKCVYNPSFTNEDKECQPCPANKDLWYKDKDCTPQVASGKDATNLTQGNTKAETVTANASDRIEYKVSLYNVGKVPATVEFKEELSDVLEYSTLQDNGGGTLNTDSKVLSWGSVTLKPGEKQTRTFVVALAAEIPATSRGTSEPSSYDCIMTNAFGNTVNINVNCSGPKVVEEIVSQLPSTGPSENILFAGIVGSIVTYFYARSRQMTKEVRLIRKEFNMGTI
ncbi:hypothetical protein H7Y40_02310 [Pedobacter sp.]|nr:hypothetical protein [Candidatus Saccharibacteria bacterium]